MFEIFKKAANFFAREPETGPMTLAEYVSDTARGISKVHIQHYARCAHQGRYTSRAFPQEFMDRGNVEQSLIKRAAAEARFNQLPADTALLRVCDHVRIVYLLPKNQRQIILPPYEPNVLELRRA